MKKELYRQVFIFDDGEVQEEWMVTNDFFEASKDANRQARNNEEIAEYLIFLHPEQNPNFAGIQMEHYNRYGF